MKRWYKRNFYFNELNNMLLNTILAYAVCAGITYFAYLNGIITTAGIDEISFEINNLVFAPTAPFIIIYTLLQFGVPAFLGLWLFFEYYKKFSTIEKINRIVPISNKKKIINMTMSTVVFYIGFLIITYICNFNMGVRDDKAIYRIVLILATALFAIIADILCREKKLGNIANLILVIIATIISFNGWSLLFEMLKEYLNNTLFISIISLVVFCILEFIYILKKIDNIKIS
ncbi:hypothetical protein [Clostridium sp.]|uniref:hypothetical protein n=1 Tax=Clostridium sp. TaxID=1506 RepID=UPI001B543DFF|nr:hypothetical protein [Clostridium sp.]MBP3917515.1 hypothetical protein [Clostridium sp.]